MINPINAVDTKQQYYVNQKTQISVSKNEQNFELPNLSIGQAILARNNISFRNLSEPIEITYLQENLSLFAPERIKEIYDIHNNGLGSYKKRLKNMSRIFLEDSVA